MVSLSTLFVEQENVFQNVYVFHSRYIMCGNCQVWRIISETCDCRCNLIHVVSVHYCADYHVEFTYGRIEVKGDAYTAPRVLLDTNVTPPCTQHARGTLPPQRDFAPSEEHCPLRGTLPPQRDFAPSEGPCHTLLYSPLQIQFNSSCGNFILIGI